jgi:NAD-dependent dihydropyrimidine dehydrogenase PreA subunit
MGQSLRIVLYEGSGSQPMSAGKRFQTLKTLLEKGYSITCTGSRSEVAPADDRDVLVLGCFEEGKVPSAQDVHQKVSLHFRNVQWMDSARILETVETLVSEMPVTKPGGWKPWFPVIDYDRCTNCMQCLSFCLFDVYGSSTEGKIRVQNPHKCKTDCPACSRVCPEVAILFPKYRAGPINGDVVNDEDLQREKMKVDISALLGGDIYALLRERSQRAQSRFSKERDDQRALKERQRCLARLQEQMEIPPEVLTSLPNQDEIRFRAEKAKAAALEALNRQSRASQAKTESKENNP